jgi:transposase
VNDVTQASDLVRGLSGRAVVGDRVYDSDAFLAQIERKRMLAVIPPRSNRKVQRPLDSATYVVRNVIERVFGRLKAFRRVATRYDKTEASFAATLALGWSLIFLSGWVA